MRAVRIWSASTLVVLGLFGCQSDLELTQKTFRCRTTAECVDGYQCVPFPEDSTVRICAKPGTNLPGPDAGDVSESDADAFVTPDADDGRDVGPLPEGEVVVTTGKDFSCAFMPQGDAYCWGNNAVGQLGTGEASASLIFAPTQVDMPEAKFISTPATVGSNGKLTCAIATDRTVYCWGDNYYGGVDATSDALEIATPTQIPFNGASPVFEQVSVGQTHACALTTSNELYCWGSNENGELGVGSIGDNQPTLPPTPVDDAPLDDQRSEVFVQVAAGLQFTCALSSENRLYCWGDNFEGQLADGTQTGSQYVKEATRGDWLFSENAVRLTAGASSACVLVASGAAYCWGDNVKGQLGVGDLEVKYLEPTEVEGEARFSALWVGDEHSCGLTEDKRAICWGRNYELQLGFPNTDADTADYDTPGTSVDEGLSFRQLAPAMFHTCGVSTDDVVYCWGSNENAQRGNGVGPSPPTAVPQKVVFNP